MVYLLESFETLLEDRKRAWRALEIYRQRFSDVGLYENCPYDSIEKTLSDLRRSGARLLAATSKPADFVQRIVAHFGMTDHFEAVHGSKLDGTRCYKAELIGWIIHRHHLHASKAVMIGDRSHDIIATRANGLASVGVLYGYGTRNELLEAGAAVLRERPSMLLEALGSLASSSSGR